MKDAKIYKITPVLHDKIWGGRELANLGKGEGQRIGESWELSFVKGQEATVDGIPIGCAIPREQWGENCRRFESFPVLTKFIDAGEKLSVQVHPDDNYALAHEGEWGKCEMWYVVSAEDGAGVYLGLNREITKEELRSRAEAGDLEEVLSFKPVRAGEVIFIPPGTIHSIGGGVVIFEIQQSSDLTYRIYDYMRRDGAGNLRRLHLDKAVEVADLKPYEAPPRVELSGEIIGSCDYFETRKCKLNFTKKRYIADESSFVCITCIGGAGSLDGESISLGDTLLVPAGYGEFVLEGNCTLLLVSVPKKRQ